MPVTAVFMSSDPDSAPPALLHNLKHNKVLHERVVVLSVDTAEKPHVPASQRVTVQNLRDGFYRIIVRYGFAEDVDLPKALTQVDEPGLDLSLQQTTFFLGRERVLTTNEEEMAIWRDRHFGVLTRNAHSATSYFCIPPNRVVELGAQVEL